MDDLQKRIEWIQNVDLQQIFESSNIPHPWFAAFKSGRGIDHDITWYSALVQPALIPKCLQDESWDLGIDEGTPSVWTHYEQGVPSKKTYTRFGKDGIEPIAIYREFYGMRDDYFELNQEFAHFHNLFHDRARQRFIKFDSRGEESEAARYGPGFFEIRTDLLLRFCTIRQMALAIFVDGFRHSEKTMTELGFREEIRERKSGSHWVYHNVIVKDNDVIEEQFKTLSGFCGKKYILPEPISLKQKDEAPKRYQEFIIATDAQGQPVKHTCDPERLANYFGKNRNAPDYLTPVFFRPAVLSKYYADPDKYSVEDGYLRCGSLWGLRMDNDHTDCVCVYLGDLGRLSEAERDYWLSFNIPPEGRSISETGFRRGFLAIPTNPKRPDLMFKHEYPRFCDEFRKLSGWDFFLPLHQDDRHFLTALRVPTHDDQAEFDSQLLALTKLLVDSLNEQQISKGLATLQPRDKGITKLQRFLEDRGVTEFESHIAFLRVLQNLRSTSAAHRKGSNYDLLVKQLKLADAGHQHVFQVLLNEATALIRFLREQLLGKRGES